MCLKSACKISTTNTDYLKNSQTLLRLPLHGGEENHLNVVSSSNSILELQFLRAKNRQISVANITFKLLRRNIKLLGMGNGNKILKIENSQNRKLSSLEGCQENKPPVPCSCKSSQSSL